MPHRNAASVLPDPVGAEMSTCSPEAIAGHACSWAGVGAANAAPNQLRTAGENWPSRIDLRVRPAATPGLRVSDGSGTQRERQLPQPPPRLGVVGLFVGAGLARPVEV